MRIQIKRSILINQKLIEQEVSRQDLCRVDEQDMTNGQRNNDALNIPFYYFHFCWFTFYSVLNFG